MTVGICTRYRHNDATHAALAVARYLDNTGRESSLMCYDWRAAHVDSAYDNRWKKVKGASWLDSIKYMIWTEPVDEHFVEVTRQNRIKNTLFTSWDRFEPYDERTVSIYNYILVPTITQAMQLKARFGINNVAVLPFACGYPITKRRFSTDPDKIQLFMSFYGSQLKRVDLSAILVLADVLETYPNVHLTIATSRGLAPYAIRDLRMFSKKYGGRWNVVYTTSWIEHVRLMGRADLTIWPAKWDGMGLIGTTSLHMGTPVIAWDAAPMNEYLTAGRNSILVNCDIEYDWLGMPRVIPDYVEFTKMLKWLLGNKKTIAALRANTHEKLEEWDDEFEKGLNAILPL